MNFKVKKQSLVLEWIFYGNLFYGICAVAQSIEATLQQKFPLNGWIYYGLVFVATVLFYNYPYARRQKGNNNHPRAAWNIRNHGWLAHLQVLFTLILTGALFVFTNQHKVQLLHINGLHWFLLLIFPVVAALYYGSNFLSSRHNLRNIGLLKPFIIGFTWAGLLVIYPVLFTNILAGEPYTFTLQGVLLFFKNLMFISLLCIMFDIKDYASDHRENLRTFVVRIGLRKTIFYILLPLPLLGIFTFLTYALTHEFSAMKIIMNMIPFFLLLLAANSLRKRRPLMYYLVVIDGLMLVKALCGTMAMLLF
jgi:hypothetical protein